MKNKHSVFPIVLFLTILSYLISCQQQKTEWHGTIEEADGVTVVKNPEEPIYGEIEFEESISIQEKTNFIKFSRIDKAWKYTKGKDAKVAILDWLFDVGPEALKKYLNPTSLIPEEPIGSEEPWHGEWMAEIVHLIAPEAKIIPIRARRSQTKKEKLGSKGQTYEPYLIKGICFAANQGVVAISNSMGPVKHSDTLRAAIDYAEEKGAVFINVHPEYLVYTEDNYKECDSDIIDKRIIHPGLVSVPQYPVEPEPNRDIYVWPYQINPKFRDGWGYSNGPPIVAGVIALMKSVNPNLTPVEVRNIIIKTAYIWQGFRVLDAEAAVNESIRRKDN